MICLEIVDLLLEEDGPEVFAEELDHVQIVDEAGPVAGESGKEKSRVSQASFLFAPTCALPHSSVVECGLG